MRELPWSWCLSPAMEIPTKSTTFTEENKQISQKLKIEIPYDKNSPTEYTLKENQISIQRK